MPVQLHYNLWKYRLCLDSYIINYGNTNCAFIGSSLLRFCGFPLKTCDQRKCPRVKCPRVKCPRVKCTWYGKNTRVKLKIIISFLTKYKLIYYFISNVSIVISSSESLATDFGYDFTAPERIIRTVKFVLSPEYRCTLTV